MDKEVIMIVVICIVAMVCAVAAAVYQYYQSRKTLNYINDMLEHAIKGDLTEQKMDESLMSKVESNMAKYLSASELSARNVKNEKQTLHQLISDISHQTKTPLSNIKLYAELLKEANLSEEEADNVKRLCQQVDKLEFLIKNLVKMSRLESGILTLTPEKNSIQNILDTIDRQYDKMAKNKNLEFTVVPSCETAIFDEKWTVEAVGNIVDNAIKYTQTGKITVCVKGYEMFCCIEISDTGSGIREEELGSIFERFTRSSDVKNEDGVGIGLYLAREIMQQQGGYIKVASSYGKGSVFQLYFRKS